MKEVFIPTQNFQKLQALCSDLLKTQLGLEMAKVIGPAGRGKSFAADKVFTMMGSDVVYVRFIETMTHVGLVRELAFALGGSRPRSTQLSIDKIRSELKTRRKVLMVDECDRMTLRHLNTLRDIHDICKTPVVMIGEDALEQKLLAERRLGSRVSAGLRFDPISPGEVAVYYKMALDQAITPKQAERLARHSDGDFRMVVNDALNIERRMKASGIGQIADELIGEVCGNGGGNGEARQDFRKSV
ncbi:MAG: ATP-binding protein [Syntrophobacteraceae bacterium]|nr:ATP-binding protein [Desulfobacteraceae bacterium]